MSENGGTVTTKSALGKGLASLLPGAASQAMSTPPPAPSPEMGVGATAAGPAIPVQSENKDRHLGISMTAVDEIQINPYQPRREFNDEKIKELANSIQTNGLIQPLVVRRTASGYQLIAGERRLRAAKLAGLKQVPIVVRKTTDRESLELALVENIQRQDLNCVDEALAYFQLAQEFSLTQEEVAQRVAKDRATVANSLRLLRLPEPILEDLKQEKLTLGHGKALLSLEDNLERMAVREEIHQKSLSVRQTEERVQELKLKAQDSSHLATSTGGAENQNGPVMSRLQSASTDLTRTWSTRVEIKGNERKGKIVVHYGSREDLERILVGLQNAPTWQNPTT